MRKVIGSLAILGVIAAIASGGTTGNSGPVAAGASPSRALDAHHAPSKRRTMHYSLAERLLVDSADVAAGKAMSAAASPDGLFERQTSQEWCSAVRDAENAFVRRHSLAWATRVDRARDAESQKFQQAAKACG
jgi:hypothetical protein